MRSLDLPRVKFETMEETVYRVLRESILRGQIAPGQRLIQEELADYFGCSRIPARDALKRLESDGLVVAEVKGRFSVVAFTDREVLEIFDLRALIEPYAARTAIAGLAQRDFAEMESLNAAMREALAREALENLTDLNFQFHMLLYGVKSRPRIGRLLSGLWFARPRVLSAGMPDYLEASFDEHDAMIDLARAGEAEALANTVHIHVDKARQRLGIPLNAPTGRSPDSGSMND